ncbi:hypothetical protein FGIG_02695 [Fasciola gigantica]|uniref:Uncharacterized protein n=1 Tax=Fasciola gigantica TaxID=46835 RepID=A0A504YEY2_FASGI|nr:hypothetical protein FGIG_02695 [Fasciola gigantica]
MLERYSTPMKVKRCDEKSETTNNSEGTSYSWYKVNPDGTSSTRLVSSRISESRFSVDRSGSPFWSDVILVNLASVFTHQVQAFSTDREELNRKRDNEKAVVTPTPIPTLVYRLIFDQVQENDYGEYICEIEHWSGKRTFLTKLQPPVASSASVKNVQFYRTGSVVRLQFDPFIMKSGDTSSNKRSTKTETSQSMSGASTKRDIDNQAFFMWMLIRICVLIEPYGVNQANNSDPKISSCSDRIKAEFIRIQPNLCTDRVVPNPERGTATILLDASNYPKTEHEVILSDLLVDNPKADSHNQSTSFHIGSHNLPIRWERVRRVAYQLRFYDSQGRLAHHTNWVYEDVEMESNMNSGCLSLKNPLSDTPLEFFQPTTTKRENFYVANASVIDSPCALLGRADAMSRRALIKIAPGMVHDSSESICSPQGSFHVIPNTPYKTNAVCLLGKTTDGRLLLSDRSISPVCTPVLRRGSVGNSPELNSFYKPSRMCASQNRTKDAQSEQVLMDSESRFMSSSSSHYGRALNTRETSHSPFHVSPLFIYNKCYPTESKIQTHCVSHVRPCLSNVSGMGSGVHFSSKPKTMPASGTQQLNSFGAEQSTFLSGFKSQTATSDSLQTDQQYSPYILTRFCHPGENSFRPAGRPICASQLMQRREFTEEVENTKFSYDTGSLKMLHHLQPVVNGVPQPLLDNTQHYPFRTLHDNQCIKPNTMAATDSGSPTSSELEASQELTRMNVLQSRSEVNGFKNFGNQALGGKNDVVLEKLTTPLPTTPPDLTALANTKPDLAPAPSPRYRTHHPPPHTPPWPSMQQP